jgi:SAM-dependent methyltransferase
LPFTAAGAKVAFVERADRERQAYDERGVFEASAGWHARFRHVFESPNTTAHERILARLLTDEIAGKRVLELGCGDGEHAERLLLAGAGYALGLDVSEKFIARAKKRELPGRLEFRLGDVMRPIEGSFDLIFGRAILHHLDYRPLLVRLREQNLRPGGRMVFMEPLGASLLIRLFWMLAPGAHTADERAFVGADLRWLRESFVPLEILPINYLSFPAGLLSSLLFRRPDNALMRLCDVADRWIAAHVRWLIPHFRQAILVIGR